MEQQSSEIDNVHNAIERTDSVESIVSKRIKSKNLWRSAAFFHCISNPKKRNSSNISDQKLSRNSEAPLTEEIETEVNGNTSVSTLSIVPKAVVEEKVPSKTKIRNSVVTIVLVEAKCLPPVPDDGVTHNIYCKFRLGLETYKTKAVASTAQPEWRERFRLHLQMDDLLKISVWEKGKQKNFMGSCLLDLSSFEAERTHEIYQQLDGGFGLIHLSVTICSTVSNNNSPSCLFTLQDFQQRHAVFSMRNCWNLVGLLHVNVLGAKGLAGKPNAYCTLELDNERVQTPQEKANPEPSWNKCYIFNVNDVTSTLDLKVYDGSLLNESMGKVSIPLLRIVNGQTCWYALKDKNKRNIAKGNCPRVCLQMTLIWNPIKASVKLFRPKQKKYVEKPPKLFDIALIYSNLEFVRDCFHLLHKINEAFKQLFEWDDAEISFLALIGWLVFCSHFQLWTVPLLLLLPFLYFWFFNRNQDYRFGYQRIHSHPVDGNTKSDKTKEERKKFIGKLHDLQIMTFTITDGVEYLASVAERLYNLVSCKVPFLSFLAMIILVISSLVLYFIPFNYLLIVLGIYKFTRKYLNPDRVLNNDLLDFISRIPDNAILKDWKELSVPEPMLRQPSGKLARSTSAEVQSLVSQNS